MKKCVLKFKVFIGICFVLSTGPVALAQTGIVKVQTQYQDVANPSSSVTYQGRGFIVEYPIRSHVTNKTVNLKLVLTAAHLVFGGIYTERLDNFKIFNPSNENQIYAMGMISDVVHDSASVVVCTKDTVDFFNAEFAAHDIDLSNVTNALNGQLFSEGGGCAASTEQGQILDDIEPFAKYVGPELVFDSAQGGFKVSSDVSEGLQPAAKIIVNESINTNFISAGQTYAVPYIPQNSTEPTDLYQVEELKNNLQSYVQEYYSLSEVPGEYSIPLSLDSGYSGSPVMTYDQSLDQLVVSGIYKSSTQSDSTDAYANFGWASPVELSQGLLNTFLGQYTQTLHRWHTFPQVYLYLNDGQLIREMAYTEFILFEDQAPAVETEPTLDAASEWIRSDTGTQLWARSDTGSAYSVNPKKSKSLVIKFRQTLEEELMLFATLDVDGQTLILPPVIESLQLTSKFNCQSCVNLQSYDLSKVAFYTYAHTNGFKDILKENLRDGSAKIYSNISQVPSLGQIEVQYIDEADKLKVQIKWSSDTIEFYILPNNNFLFLGFNGQWQESGYVSVLETQTLSGDLAILELAGILYFNSELQNANSFRLKLINQNTQLFELKEPK